MPLDTRSVYSSHVNTIAHDPSTDEMHVTWDNGKTSIYSGVSAEKFDTVANSWSIGKTLHQTIKPFHAHRYA